MSWSEVTVSQIVEHVQEEMTDKDIAERYNVSERTVQRFRKMYGIKRSRNKSLICKAVYIRMKECKLSDKQVAHIWGVTHRFVTKWKRDNELSGVAVQTIRKGTDFDGKPIYTTILIRKGGEIIEQYDTVNDNEWIFSSGNRWEGNLETAN